MTTARIPLSHIDIRPGRRSVSRADVKALAGSIQEVGLLSPIAVYRVGAAFELVAGRHRVEAAKSLGWTEIEAVLVDLNDLQREMAEIDENLVRCNLNAADTARQTARRKELYLRMHPETAQGVAGGKARHRSATADSAVAESFTADTASKTGRSVRSVREDAQIGESIPEDVFEAIADSPLADSKTDLLAMARLPEEEQRDVVANADLADKASVRAEIERHKPTRRTSEESQEIQYDDASDGFGDAPTDDDPPLADDNDAPEPDWMGSYSTDRPGAAEESSAPIPSAHEDSVQTELAPPPAPPATTDRPGDAEAAENATFVEATAPEPPEPTPASPATSSRTFEAASRTGVGVGAGNKSHAPARTFSARPLDAGDLTRALFDFTTTTVVAAMGETLSDQERGSLAAQLIDGLPTHEVERLSHRIGVRVRSDAAPSLKSIKADLRKLSTSDLLALERELPMIRKEIGQAERAAQKAAS